MKFHYTCDELNGGQDMADSKPTLTEDDLRRARVFLRLLFRSRAAGGSLVVTALIVALCVKGRAGMITAVCAAVLAGVLCILQTVLVNALARAESFRISSNHSLELVTSSIAASVAALGLAAAVAFAGAPVIMIGSAMMLGALAVAEGAVPNLLHEVAWETGDLEVQAFTMERCRHTSMPGADILSGWRLILFLCVFAAVGLMAFLDILAGAVAAVPAVLALIVLCWVPLVFVGNCSAMRRVAAMLGSATAEGTRHVFDAASGLTRVRNSPDHVAVAGSTPSPQRGEVMNEDLRNVGLAFTVLAWGRLSGASLLVGSVVAAGFLSGVAASALLAFGGLCVAVMAGLQLGVVHWLMSSRPLGTVTASTSGVVAGNCLLFLCGLGLVLDLFLPIGLLAFGGLVLGVVGLFVVESQLPAVVREVAYLVADAELASVADRHLSSAEAGLWFLKRGCSVAFLLFLASVFFGWLIAFLVPGFFAMVGLFVLLVLGLHLLWFLAVGVMNTRLLLQVSHRMSHISAEDVRHRARELHD